MTRALITGATGFIGRHLSHHLLSRGWEVIALHRPTTSTDVVAELRDSGVVTMPFSAYSDVGNLAKSSAPDVVFHLAAHYTRNHGAAEVDPLLGANIAMGTHLLEGLVDSKCVVVNAVSYLQYRMNEPVPFSLYTATKQAFVELSRFYREKRGMDIRHVVLYDNFGPNDERDKLIATIANALHDDSPMHMGSAEQLLNVLHIDDLVAGLAAASRPGNPATLTVRAKDNVSVGTIVRMLEEAAGRELDKSFDDSRPISHQVENAGVWPLPQEWVETRRLNESLAATYRSLGEK